MKKDYLPVDQTSPKQEINFVKKYWTSRWQQKSLKLAVAQVASLPETIAMKPYLPLLPQHARILDGGCGLGQWTRYFNTLGYKAVGLDISRATINRLHRLYPGDKFIYGDIRRTNFKRQSFDAYFSWGTFEHFESGLDDCFNEAYRILKPGGLLFITVPYHNLRHMIRGFFPQNLPAAGRYRFYQWRLTKQEIIEALKRHKFAVINVKPIHRAHGLRQFITHDLGVAPTSLFHRPLQILFYPFLPALAVSHMLMAVGKKQE